MTQDLSRIPPKASATASAARTDWRSEGLGIGHAAAVCALFDQVFEHPMSDALWHWKYAGGRGSASGLWQGDQLIAHYGGMHRTLWLGVTELAGLQVGDVMVHGKARGVLSRNGAFSTVARHYLGQRIAAGQDGPDAAALADLGFGFPSDRHVRLGDILGMYRALGEVRELTWVAKPRLLRQTLTWQRYALDLSSLGAQDDAVLERAWRNMQQALGTWVLPQRDAAWCRHRYAQHPQHRYVAAALRHRLTQQVVGVMILKPVAPVWEWMDWIGSPKHLGIALSQALDWAAGHGATALSGWFSEPVVRLLARHATHAQDHLACTWCVTLRRSSRVPAGADSVAWWLTGGDTDFR
jgi:hypothetical protein